ncbi:hypothetical protein APSETT444_008048 [Aspergillus pseudonomiae]
MPLPHFKLIIVGASIEGLTLAYCLHQAGINYLIFEKRNEHVPLPEEPLIIMPNGARVWNQLGLLDQMVDPFEPIETAYMTLPDAGSHEICFPNVLREQSVYLHSIQLSSLNVAQISDIRQRFIAAIAKMTGSLPRIACFHGGGSKGAIYEVQCAQLAGLLKNDFQFVFFDGPFESGPGPGILPAFRDYKPFRSWFKRDGSEVEQSDGGGYDISGRDGVERVWKLMEAAGPGGEWVGVMGFSQGTRITSGLLLDQQQRMSLGELGSTPQLKFGVLCMGGGAPMVSEIGHQFATMGSTELIKIPTLHVHGLKDMFLELGKQQHAMYYEPGTSKVYEVDYHHAMPWYKHEVRRLADLIRELYKETSRN